MDAETVGEEENRLEAALISTAGSREGRGAGRKNLRGGSFTLYCLSCGFTYVFQTILSVGLKYP